MEAKLLLWKISKVLLYFLTWLCPDIPWCLVSQVVLKVLKQFKYILFSKKKLVILRTLETLDYIYIWWGDFLKIFVDTLKHEINKIWTILRSLTLFLTTFVISVNCIGYKLGLPVIRRRTLRKRSVTRAIWVRCFDTLSFLIVRSSDESCKHLSQNHLQVLVFCQQQNE